MSKNETEFRHNPWLYAQKRLQSTKDSLEPSFSVSIATQHFTQTYSSDNTQYRHLSPWVMDSLPDCDASLFDGSAITPSLVKSTLRQCSMKSTPGSDGITYFLLNHLPSSHHFMATLFNKLLGKGGY